MSDKKLKSIPTSKFARGLRLARLTASVSATALGGKLAEAFSGKAEKEMSRLVSQMKQAKKVADALSQMKGAAMKLGQILSIHGEHLFPKEVIEVLSRLQQHSDQLEFSEIEAVVKRELGGKYGTELEALSAEPIAAASIGQVHEAMVQGVKVAVKVQYPGVDKSIDSDVDSLASVLGVLTRFPSIEGFNAVTDEIKNILRQETDYLREGQTMEGFRNYFAEEEQIVVPRYFPEVSTKHVLVSEMVGGISVQEFAESTASAAARAFLGRKFLEVFYHELFRRGEVQTDPNFANYKIQWSFGVSEPRLVLLDFGAVKSFDAEFRANYSQAMLACLADDYDAIRDAAVKMGFLYEDDPQELVDLHYELVRMFMEPFRAPYDRADGPQYRWGDSDLAERIRKFLPKFIFSFKLRPPPKDFIFLNRKIVGIYFFCSAIKAEFNPRPVLEAFVKTSRT